MEIAQVFKLSNPFSSDVPPSARSHLLNFPQSTNNWEPGILRLWGTHIIQTTTVCMRLDVCEKYLLCVDIYLWVCIYPWVPIYVC